MYHWIDHTGELEIAIEASREEEVYADALAAMRELLGERPGGDPATHEVAVSAPDRAALLVEWISELVFLAETAAFVPERVARLTLADGSLQATVEGRCDEPPPLVKAVTYHGLSFECDGDAWRATVVLDV